MALTQKWWEWPLAIATAPFIIGALIYKDWANKRWAARRMREQAAWARGDRTPWRRE